MVYLMNGMDPALYGDVCWRDGLVEGPHWLSDTSTAIVPHNDHMLHFESFHCEWEDRVPILGLDKQMGGSW